MPLLWFLAGFVSGTLALVVALICSTRLSVYAWTKLCDLELWRERRRGAA